MHKQPMTLIVVVIRRADNVMDVARRRTAALTTFWSVSIRVRIVGSSNFMVDVASIVAETVRYKAALVRMRASTTLQGRKQTTSRSLRAML